MRKFILTGAIILCIGSISAQINRYGDVLTKQETEKLKASQVQAFEDCVEGVKLTSEAGSYRGINYTIHTQWTLKKNKFTDAIKLAIDNIIAYELKGSSNPTNLSTLKNRELEFFFIKPGGKKLNLSKTYSHESGAGADYTDLEKCGVIVFTRDRYWRPICKIVSTVEPKSTKSITARILHAIGHVLHEDRLGEKSYWSQLSNFNLNFKKYDEAKAVSDRSTHSSKEFIAELFSYTLMGKQEIILPSHLTSSYRVISHYHFLFGPAIQFDR
jgi:hypothetical protein